LCSCAITVNLAMSQPSITSPSQASASTAAALAVTPAAALVSKTLLTSAKDRMKDLMTRLPDSGVARESDVEAWGRSFVDLLVCLRLSLSRPTTDSSQRKCDTLSASARLTVDEETLESVNIARALLDRADSSRYGWLVWARERLMPVTATEAKLADERKAKAAEDERQRQFETRQAALVDQYFDGTITAEKYEEELGKLTRRLQGGATVSELDETTAVGGDEDSSVKTTDAVDEDSSNDESDTKDAKAAARLPSTQATPLAKRKRDEETGLNKVSGKVCLLLFCMSPILTCP
jgi:hypothetical protein